MKQIATFLLALIFCGCTHQSNYEIKGVCSGDIPKDGKISMCLLTLEPTDGLDHRYIKTTNINTDGSFCFSGYADSPQIVYFVTNKDDGGCRWQAMSILEEGTIQLDCSAYQTERTFIDCVAHGTPNNDKIQGFYKVRNSIWQKVRESERDDDYPSIDAYVKGFISDNANNYAGVFIALEQLRLNYDMLEHMPTQIQENPTIKEMVAEWKRNTSTDLHIELID